MVCERSSCTSLLRVQPFPHLRIHPAIRAPGTSPRDIRDLGHGTARARNTLVQKELGKQEESFHMIGAAVLEAFICQGKEV